MSRVNDKSDLPAYPVCVESTQTGGDGVEVRYDRETDELEFHGFYDGGRGLFIRRMSLGEFLHGLGLSTYDCAKALEK